MKWLREVSERWVVRMLDVCIALKGINMKWGLINRCCPHSICITVSVSSTLLLYNRTNEGGAQGSNTATKREVSSLNSTAPSLQQQCCYLGIQQTPHRYNNKNKQQCCYLGTQQTPHRYNNRNKQDHWAKNSISIPLDMSILHLGTSEHQCNRLPGIHISMKKQQQLQ